jgi:Fe2+ transport system protein B
MVLFAFCSQCGATGAVVARQLNWRWGLRSFGGMTALARLAAVAGYQAGLLMTN